MTPADLESAPRPQHTRNLVAAARFATLAKRSRVRTLVVSAMRSCRFRAHRAIEQRLSINGFTRKQTARPSERASERSHREGRDER